MMDEIYGSIRWAYGPKDMNSVASCVVLFLTLSSFLRSLHCEGVMG
jgi:hypothetical protein